MISTARSYFLSPEGQSTGVRLAIEKVVIVLAGEVLWIINYIRRRLCRVVVDGHGGDRRPAETNARWITQVDIESLWSFNVEVVIDEHGETLRGLARGEAQGADCGDVITALAGGDV